MYSCKVFHILKQKVLCFCTQPSCGLKVDHLDSLECLFVGGKLQTEELCCRWWQYVYTFNNLLFWLQHQHNSWERERAMGNVNSTEKWILITNQANCTTLQKSISTVPPAASKAFFTSSASSLLTFSFTFVGSSSINFLA